MTKLKNVMFAGSLVMALPVVVSAQEGELESLLESALRVLDNVALIALGLAFLFFIWGLAIFILRAGDDSEREKGKKTMLWGIIALVVISSIWGIVTLIQNTLNIGGDGTDLDDPRRTPWREPSNN